MAGLTAKPGRRQPEPLAWRHERRARHLGPEHRFRVPPNLQPHHRRHQPSWSRFDGRYRARGRCDRRRRPVRTGLRRPRRGDLRRRRRSQRAPARALCMVPADCAVLRTSSRPRGMAGSCRRPRSGGDACGGPGRRQHRHLRRWRRHSGRVRCGIPAQPRDTVRGVHPRSRRAALHPGRRRPPHQRRLRDVRRRRGRHVHGDRRRRHRIRRGRDPGRVVPAGDAGTHRRPRRPRRLDRPRGRDADADGVPDVRGHRHRVPRGVRRGVLRGVRRGIPIRRGVLRRRVLGSGVRGGLRRLPGEQPVPRGHLRGPRVLRPVGRLLDRLSAGHRPHRVPVAAHRRRGRHGPSRALRAGHRRGRLVGNRVRGPRSGSAGGNGVPGTCSSIRSCRTSPGNGELQPGLSGTPGSRGRTSRRRPRRSAGCRSPGPRRRPSASSPGASGSTS